MRFTCAEKTACDISILYMHLMSTQYVFSVLNTFKDFSCENWMHMCRLSIINSVWLSLSSLCDVSE